MKKEERENCVKDRKDDWRRKRRWRSKPVGEEEQRREGERNGINEEGAGYASGGCEAE